MNQRSRIVAMCAYLIPVFAWLYIFFFERKNLLALYHLKQSIGLVLFLLAATLAWMVVGWVVAWIPYMAVLSIALFALVLAAYLFALVAWLMGLSNALRARTMPLPLFGEWASSLPIS
jgi:uncharacterized membrane protein